VGLGPFLRRLWGWLQVLRPGIWLATGSEPEIRTREQLLALLRRYDLGKWQFTKRIRIDERARLPHSHPVLTLNTRYDGNLLLSIYLHEQLHWFVWRHRSAKAVIEELRRYYPRVPVARPEGSGSEVSSRQHYLVCYLEYAALIELLDLDEARRVIEHWSGHHYTEIYKTVLRDSDAIGEIVSRHSLVP
jgi:hypothetical protein